MTPVGETLRRERIKRNLELDTISSELKISSRFLQAIESDQFEKLPGGVFAKSFVRQYAHLLGLDEEELAGQVERLLAPAVPQGGDRPKPGGVVQIQVPKVDEWETVGDKRFRWSGLLSVAALVAVMLVCSAVYSWMQRPKANSVAVQTAVPTSAPTPVPTQVQTPVQTAAPPNAQPIPQTTVVQPSASAASEVKPADSKPAREAKPAGALASESNPADAKVAAPNPNATVHVEITADELVWVLARADGKYAFSATMDAHSTRTVEGVKDVVVRLGNAGGVTISLNGKPIGPAGPKGQVRTVQFTSGGFQIVPAKPPSALDPPRPL
jgi:cytoskeleton protein RodZ